jgi:peptidoglycan-N-acetylglucosamine deacetylase
VSPRWRWRSRSSLGCLAALTAFAALGPVGPAAASAGDGRGVTHVHETPQPPAAAGERVVSLTFDDGPHRTYTPQVLDVLARHGVKATFFLLGSEAERHPDLVRRIAAEGHAVANHTWDHPDLRRLDADAFGRQVDRTNDVLQELTGVRPTCVRPPFGRADGTVGERLARRGLASVVWTGDSRDFEKPGADTIVASALRGLQPGGVILLHDGGGRREQTVQALPRIIEGIRAAGYRTAPICVPDRQLPYGSLLGVRAGTGRIELEGWATDPDAVAPLDVHLHLDGARRGTARTTGRAAADEPGPRYATSLPAGPGRHEVCAYAVDRGAGGGTAGVGCAEVEVGPLTRFDDLRPLVARVRFSQLLSQARAIRDVADAHEGRRLPWVLATTAG